MNGMVASIAMKQITLIKYFNILMNKNILVQIK